MCSSDLVLCYLSCDYHGFWFPRGGVGISGCLSVVNAGFEQVSVSVREQFSRFGQSSGRSWQSAKSHHPARADRRARNELRSAGTRKSVQIDELTETVVIASARRPNCVNCLRERKRKSPKEHFNFKKPKRKSLSSQKLTVLCCCVCPPINFQLADKSRQCRYRSGCRALTIQFLEGGKIGCVCLFLQVQAASIR